MAIREAIDVLISEFVQLGLGGPAFKRTAASTTEMAIRNASDSGYGNLLVAAPTDANHAATKLYVDSREGVLKMDDQADTSGGLPTNTGAERWLVVTEPGTGAVIGDLLYDDGSGSGNMTIYPAEARTIFIPVAFSGNTQTFDADSLYIWDVEGGQWVKVGDIGAVTGARRVIRYALDNSAAQDSSSQIPANARIHEVRLEVTTPYSGGSTITVGNTGDPDLFMIATDLLAQEAGAYHKRQDTGNGGSADNVRVAVSGSPAAGAGVVVVEYSVPNA